MDDSVKPLLKWAGGKTQLLPELTKRIPDNIENYAEPFVGAGALLFHLITKKNIKNIYISDTNPELILLYQIVRDYPIDLINELYTLEENYNQKKAKGRESFYYLIRERFNKNIYKTLGIQNSIKRVAQMLFINRTCFNGLWRVNSKTGYFNVPFNKGGILIKNDKIILKKHKVCFSENILLASQFLKNKNTAIIQGDYSQLEHWEFINHPKTFIYFDPPYRPINRTSSFVSYTKNKFDDQQQTILANFIKKISYQNKVMLSNSNPQQEDINDTFFIDIYKQKNLKYETISANRLINSNKLKRNKITEILVHNL